VTWTLTIPDAVTPLYNAWSRIPRLRKGKRRAKHTVYQQDLKHMWRLYLLEAGMAYIPSAKGKRKVTVYRHSPNKCDRANIWTPIDKLILDALVDEGILKDDSEEWADVHCEPVKAKEKKMVVEVRE